MKRAPLKGRSSFLKRAVIFFSISATLGLVYGVWTGRLHSPAGQQEISSHARTASADRWLATVASDQDLQHSAISGQLVPRLLLASHNRLFWYSAKGVSEVHRAQGVYYGVFQGHAATSSSNATVWVVSRPHNWRPSNSAEHLLHLDLNTGSELDRIQIPTRFAHDAVRWHDKVYVCSTGTGQILEFAYPQMTFRRVLGELKDTSHVNTLAPDGKGGLWALLHQKGQSEIVHMDMVTGAIMQRISDFGQRAHGLVQWRQHLLTLDSASAALVLVHLEHRSVKRLWKAPDVGRFLKGLSVVDDVAYFGIAKAAPRSARHDPALNCELAAFDLLKRRLLWRIMVPTQGLLNTIGAPHLGEGSPYLALRTDQDPAQAQRRALRSLLWWPLGRKDGAYCARYSAFAAGCEDDSGCQLVNADPLTGQPLSCVPCTRLGGCAPKAKRQLPFTEHADLPATISQQRSWSAKLTGKQDFDLEAWWGPHKPNVELSQQLSQPGLEVYKDFATPVGGRWSSGLPHMDLSLKNWDGRQAGIRLDLASVNVTALKAAVQSYGPQLWDGAWLAEENAVLTGREANLHRYKPGVRDIKLIFSDNLARHVYRFPLYDAFQPLIQPILEQLLGPSDMDRVMRLQLTCMPERSVIHVHQDTGGYAHEGHRIHVPLIVPPSSNAALFLTCPGERRMGHVALAECINLPLEEGMAFELNNVLPHAVRNEGPGMRVHLLIDVSKRHYASVTQLRRGEVCSYEKGMSNCGSKKQWSLWTR